MTSHVWKLLTLKESLWVKWIHEYKLKGRNFWDIPLRGNMSWGWRKILRLRPVIRRFIWSKLGNGHATSLWFDKWSTLEPLANFVSSRDMARAGLSLKSKVSDVLVYGNWSWPNDLVTKYPILPNYNTPINNELDRLVWSDHFGNIQKFSVSQVWSDIRNVIPMVLLGLAWLVSPTLSMTYAFVKRRTSESVGATACGGLRRLNYILARRIGWLFQKDKLKEIQQAARDEAWVPKADRVKISTRNVRIDPTMTQKEETYQVVLDIIKNTTFYKAFLATTDVPEIYMQQFWHTVTKIKESTFYKFKLANKKSVTPKPASVEVFDESDPKPAKRQTGTEEEAQGKFILLMNCLVTEFLTPEEKLAADTMQALKASKNISRSQPHAGGLSEGIGVLPGVPDESTVILTTLREGVGTKPGVPDKKRRKICEDDRSIDIKKTDDDEETDDEFEHGDEYVRDDVDKKMKNAEDAKTGKDKEELTDTEKTKATKGDLEQAQKLPLSRSSLSVSSGFGNQFLNLSSDTSLIGTSKESADTGSNSLLDIQIHQEGNHRSDIG
ncbi:hypothetical protein Tco_0476351 [Tanacetum coccineum]